MATITPTLKIVSTASDNTAATGPSAFALNLNQTDTLANIISHNVDELVMSQTDTLILDGSSIGGATLTPGTVGCYLYMKNTSAVNGDDIRIGIVSSSVLTVAGDGQTTVTGSDAPQAPHEDTEDDTGGGSASTGDSRLNVASNQTLRTFTLLPGEFAFFPFDFAGDIYASAAQNSPVLEIIRFNK